MVAHGMEFVFWRRMVVGEMDAFVDSQSVREDVLLLGQLGIVLRDRKSVV